MRRLARRQTDPEAWTKGHARSTLLTGHWKKTTGPFLEVGDHYAPPPPDAREMSQHMAHAPSIAGVVYDASTPLNKVVRARMASTTLGEFLGQRAASSTPVITLEVDDSVGHAMEVRARSSQVAAVARVAFGLCSAEIGACRPSRATASLVRRCSRRPRLAAIRSVLLSSAFSMCLLR